MKTRSKAAVCLLPILVCFAGPAIGTASAQAVPSPWATRDIGAPRLTGSATFASGVFTLDGAGTDIWSTSDQFHFVYQAVSGDTDISARIDSVDPVYAYTNVGVMIRSSLSATAAHAYTAVTSSKGVYFRRRATSGALATAKTGPKTAAPTWVRLVRKGTAVTSYSSRDGVAWSAIGTSTIALGTTAYVGMALTSHNAYTRATALVSNVKVIGGALAPAASSGYTNQDIGKPALAGDAAYASGKHTIKAAGYDIWDTRDEFHFVWKQVTGDVELIARVASITNAHAWSKGGVMVRESLAASARHATMLLSYGKGYAFQRRPEPGVYSEHTSGGAGVAPGWVRIVRTGDLFEAYRSSNGTSWTRVGTDTIAMGDTVYVGLAFTSHNTAKTTTAVVDNVKVIESAASVNKAPTVSITAPSAGASLTAGANTVTATASDPENRMASVDFYAGSALIGRDTTAPYSATWTPAAGTVVLTATAHDADGRSSTSSGITVTVSAPATTTLPRAVAFKASADHATNVSNYVLKVFAAGANPATATPLSTSDLGKPTPSSAGEITVDRATFFSRLAAGSYLATVAAVGPGGQTQSTAVAFTR